MKKIKNNSRKIVCGISILTALLIVHACHDRDEPRVEATIAGINVNPPDVDLYTAVITGNLQVLRQNIEAGAHINGKDDISGSTPLINACILGNTEVAKALIEGGAALNDQNNEGFTALIAASYFCHPEIVRLLLYNRADRTLKNKSGQTAYEAVHAPFENVRSDYDKWGRILEPLAIKLDYSYIEKTRPAMESMLKYD